MALQKTVFPLFSVTYNFMMTSSLNNDVIENLIMSQFSHTMNVYCAKFDNSTSCLEVMKGEWNPPSQP